MDTTLIFWLGTAFFLSVSITACRMHKWFMYGLLALMIFSTVDHNFSITFLSQDDYRIATRGFEVHLADLCAIALAVSIFLRKNTFHLLQTPPLLLPMLLFLGMSVVSWIMIETPFLPNPYFDVEGVEIANFELWLYPLFEISKIFRGIFIFVVCFYLFQDEGCRRVFIGTCSLLLVYLLIASLFARYVEGQHRVALFDKHPNDYTAYVAFLGLFLLPRAFTCEGLFKGFYYSLYPGIGLIIIILTIARSSLFAFVLASIAIVLLAFLRYPSAKSMVLIFCGFVAGVLLLVKSYDTLIQRFDFKKTEAAQDLRDVLNVSAKTMGNDHPINGVGIGNYTAYLITDYAGRHGEGRADLLAHHQWYLTYAETGLLGVAAFALIWVCFYLYWVKGCYFFALHFSREEFATLLGVLGATFYYQLQNLYHFTFRETSNFLFLHIMLALAVSMIAFRIRERRKELRVA